MSACLLQDVDRAAEFANQMQTNSTGNASLKGLIKVGRGTRAGIKRLSGRLYEQFDTVRKAADPDAYWARLFAVLKNVLQDLFKYKVYTVESR